MSELTGRAKNRASGAQTAPGAAARAAQEPAEDAALPRMTGEMSGDDPVVRRTKDGWRVGDADVPDLTSAMVLADLISAELAAPENLAGQPAAAGMSNATAADAVATSSPASDSTAGRATANAAPEDVAGQATVHDQAAAATAQAAAAQAAAAQAGPGGVGRPGKAKSKGKSKDPASETSKLRTTIGQLEHALTARIRVEQAIGVLAERHRIQPRQAFEQLRTAARNRGRRVIDIASDVVASASNPLLQLPEELSRPRATGRQGRRNRQTPGILSSE